MKTVLVTGGGGFIGSHVVEWYAERGWSVRVLDNLSRMRILGRDADERLTNWEYVKGLQSVEAIRGDVRDRQSVEAAADGVDLIVHCAAQTAVTTSVVDPEQDFTTNLVGTFHVLDAARNAPKKPTIVFCSTNKVYGENVNAVPIVVSERRYTFGGEYTSGIPETFGVDLCEHTPYGCSKLSADLYMQDYAHLYGLKIGVFRMSCIYGTRQFGVEDQGWVAWFVIATLLGKPINIDGDGKQVRDTLYVTDLVRAYDAFVESDLLHGVFNMGGGPAHTLSLLDLLDLLEDLTGKRSPITFRDWRPSDQKVYISDIRRAERLLRWRPEITPEEGVRRLVEWVEEHRDVFQ
jgi:CDP-paratose 2-epimerase